MTLRGTLTDGKLLLSLLGTPWLIFAATATHLYVKNQADLFYRIEVLLPFVALTFLIGLCALWLFQRVKNRPAKHLLWGYYLLGPLFLVYTLLRKVPYGYAVRLTGAALAIAAFVYLVRVLQRKAKLEQVADTFALMSLAFIVLSTFELAHKYLPAPESQGNLAQELARHPGSGRDRPNVYHIILDEFQTEMFTLTLTPEVREALGGFVFFPETTSLFGRTGMSIPSVLTGRMYDFDTPQIEYQKSAFNSEQSFLHWLQEDGYQTLGYFHPTFRFEMGLFDVTTLHDTNSSYRPPLGPVIRFFARFWVYSVVPRSVLGRLGAASEQQQLDNQNLLNPAAPIVSLHSLRAHFALEPELAAHNRYTYAHLILPHFPYVLSADCRYSTRGTPTSPIEQSKCATQLILDLVNLLKKLDRFSSSLIIIHSDHGARFAIIDGKLLSVEGTDSYYTPLWNTARSRPLLLIKPPGVSDSRALITSHAEATLMDIAPTLAKVLDLKAPEGLEGISLIDPVVMELKRDREYYFFDKKAKHGWTDVMTRFEIIDGNMTLDGPVYLTNNPKPD